MKNDRERIFSNEHYEYRLRLNIQDLKQSFFIKFILKFQGYPFVILHKNSFIFKQAIFSHKVHLEIQDSKMNFTKKGRERINIDSPEL